MLTISDQDQTFQTFRFSRRMTVVPYIYLSGTFILLSDDQNDYQVPLTFHILWACCMIFIMISLSVLISSKKICQNIVSKITRKSPPPAPLFFVAHSEWQSYRREEGNDAWDPQIRRESIKDVLAFIIAQNLCIHLVRKPKGFLRCLKWACMCWPAEGQQYVF